MFTLPQTSLLGRWLNVYLFFILVFAGSAGILHGQNINKIQYFFDSDPGVGQQGNGGFIQVGIPGDSINESLTIPTTGLAPGSHMLYVRSQDVSGRWGFWKASSIYISPPATITQQIVAVEYFIDQDPGLGNATPLSVPLLNQGDSINLSTTITMPSLSMGQHAFYLRTKDNTGRWSLAVNHPFNICSTYGATSFFDYSVSGNEVYFENLSLHDSIFIWDFGDGHTETSQRHPRHEYANTGVTNNVCLTSTNVCATSTLCKPVSI